ncbi:MAG: hypothetical protein JWO03_3320 [Bacteroidetes bacterium]|nr:hypothetical protein [Bacteroidota bacterium]
MKKRTLKTLTVRDISFGIGRKATAKELGEYLDRPHGKSIPLRKAIDEIKQKLSQKK